MITLPTARHQRILAVAAVALTLVFAVAPLRSLLELGPFSWHIEQPSFYEGLAEIIVLGLAAWVCAKFRRRGAWIALGVLCLLYARRHGVDVSIAVMYLYLEGIHALGANLSTLACKWSRGTDQEARSLLTTAGAGLSTWLAVLWLHSLFHLGGVIDVRTLAIVLLGAAVLFNRADPLYRRIANGLVAASREAPVSFAVLVPAFFGFFAKSARTLAYDSMWYGLQLQKTLTPDGSLFDPTGLVNAVYYYPKLYESLLLPLTASGSTSTLYGLGIFAVFFAGMLARRIWALAQNEDAQRKPAPWWPMLIALCIPALLSVSLTTKGDAFAAACGMAAVVCACESWSDKSRSWALFGLTFAGFSCLARLSALPYAALLAVILLGLAVVYARRAENSFEASLRIAIFVVSLLVATLVLYRSWLLAGVPFISPTPLVDLEAKLGLVVNYPVGASPAGGADRVHLPFFSTLLTYTLLPARAFVASFSWAGNTWVLAPLLAVLLARRRIRTGPFALLLGIGLSGVFVLFAFKFRPDWGADGNYFIIPFLCLTLAGAAHFPARGLPVALLGLSAVMAASISLLTGTWYAGTRPLDLNFHRDNRQLAHYIDYGLDHTGLSGLAHFLATAPEDTRSIGITPTSKLTTEPGWLLPRRFEPVATIAWSRPEILASADNFGRFLQHTCMDYVILPQTGKGPDKHQVLIDQLHDYLTTAAGRQQASVAYADDNVVAWHTPSRKTACRPIR